MKLLRLLICIILLSTPVYANIVIKGVIKKSTMVPVDSSAVLTDGRIEFPKKSYKIEGIVISGLSYVEPAKINKKAPDLSTFHSAVLASELKKLKFNEQNGEFKFQLRLKPRALVNWQLNTVSVKTLPIRGVVLVNNDSQQILSGKVNYHNHSLKNFQNSNENFHLKMEGDTLILKAQRDIPVIMELET